MPLSLTQEQEEFVAAVQDFCRRECGTREQRDKLTEHGRKPHNVELYQKMADLGWLGVATPEEYGGAGGGMVDLALFLEATSYGMAPIGGFGVSSISVGPYERFGTEAQKREVLTNLVRGGVEHGLRHVGLGPDAEQVHALQRLDQLGLVERAGARHDLVAGRLHDGAGLGVQVLEEQGA